MAASSGSHGKDIDRSSPWSDWTWDNRGFWMSTRFDSAGITEYRYQIPETTVQTPRTPGKAASSSIYSDRDSNARNDPSSFYRDRSHTVHSTDSDSGPAYTSRDSQDLLLNRASSYGSSQSTAEDCWKGNTSSFNNSPSPSRMPASTNAVLASPTSLYSSSGPNYYQIQHSGAKFKTEELARATQGLTLSSHQTTPEQGPLESSSGEQQIWQKNGGRIPSVPGNKSYEELDPRYHVIEDVKKLRKFWRVGRVFMMLWSEPARAYRDVGKSRDGSHYSTTYLNGNVYSEIRRFVVIREGHGNCICSPIHTYNNQATLKPNLPDVQQHAIIYTSKSAPPSLCSYNDSGEVIAREDLNKDPLRVIPEGPLPEADLGIYSRINYSKIYTVENYVRVLNIGLVHQNSMQSLIANSLVRQNDQAPQALRSKAIGAASTDNRDETQASENGERVDRSEKNKEKRKKPSGSGRKK